MSVPLGMSTRPAEAGDLQAVYELVAADERRHIGQIEIEPQDIASFWARPSFDLATDSITVWEGERLVGYAEVFAGKDAETDVHPDALGRVIGTFLREWTEQRALAVADQGANVLVGQTIVDADEAGATMFRTQGYEPLWTSWILRTHHDEQPAEPTLPAGLTFRSFELGRDEHDTFRLIEDAFGEWPDRDPSTFEDWSAFTIGRSDFDPKLTLLVCDREEIVGVAICLHYSAEGWVHQLAVKASHRRRGLGRALLQLAFAILFEKGERTVGLATDSRTGAVGLYENVGMHIARSYTHWAKQLRRGKEG